MTKIIDQVKNVGRKAVFFTKRNAPTILVCAGVTGAVAGCVVACYETTKMSQILEDNKKAIEFDKEQNDGSVSKKTYAKAALAVAKNYAPAVAIEAASVACILVGAGIMKKRQAALSSAYAALAASFSDYRNRVAEKYGDSAEKEIRYNIHDEKVETEVVDENGKTKKKKETVSVGDVEVGSPYARCFCELCSGWSKSAEQNRMFLELQQALANKMLDERGFLFLNDVYELLDFPKTTAGAKVGWIKKNPNGDGFIDFNMYDMTTEAKRRFMNGYERSIILDFNVDGPIIDLVYDE